MPEIDYYQEKFDINSFTDRIDKASFEDCEFTSCILAGKSLQNFKFIDCSFIECDLSLCGLEKCSFINCTFKDSKLVGLKFEDTNPIGISISLERCNLDSASFYEMDLTKFAFEDCNLNAVDFANSNLSKIALPNCVLSGAIFENTNLEQTDFSSALHFDIDPTINRIKGAKFSIPAVLSLLKKFDIVIES